MLSIYSNMLKKLGINNYKMVKFIVKIQILLILYQISLAKQAVIKDNFIRKNGNSIEKINQIIVHEKVSVCTRNILVSYYSDIAEKNVFGYLTPNENIIKDKSSVTECKNGEAFYSKTKGYEIKTKGNEVIAIDLDDTQPPNESNSIQLNSFRDLSVSLEQQPIQENKTDQKQESDPVEYLDRQALKQPQTNHLQTTQLQTTQLQTTQSPSSHFLTTNLSTTHLSTTQLTTTQLTSQNIQNNPDNQSIEQQLIEDQQTPQILIIQQQTESKHQSSQPVHKSNLETYNPLFKQRLSSNLSSTELSKAVSNFFYNFINDVNDYVYISLIIILKLLILFLKRNDIGSCCTNQVSKYKARKNLKKFKERQEFFNGFLQHADRHNTEIRLENMLPIELQTPIHYRSSAPCEPIKIYNINEKLNCDSPIISRSPFNSSKLRANNNEEFHLQMENPPPYGTTCSCPKTKCFNLRCPCRKAGVKCNSYCHKGQKTENNCSN